MTAQQLDAYTQVVLAPNPSPMTLDGTNTYVLSAPDSHAAVVIDPGPDVLEHFHAVEAAITAAGGQVDAVIITHHHLDHAEAAGWSARWNARLYAFAPDLMPAPAEPLRDGETLSVAGLTLTAVHTPGHTSDHLCLQLAETNAVFSGDHILGRGTTVVLHPDGDMGAYFASLERVAGLSPDVLYPAHGPMIDDPAGWIAGYVSHRREREAQVLSAVKAGYETPGAIVDHIYPTDLSARLKRAARATVQAHLAHLTDQGELVG